MGRRTEWDERYAAQRGDYSASWPDLYARQLELQFLASRLPFWPDAVVEVGCGALSLCESPGMVGWLTDAKSYLGFDGSPEALRVGRARAAFVGLTRARLDFQDFETNSVIPPGFVLICRRLLINLSSGSRQALIRRFSAFRHGVVLEATMDGLEAINGVRAYNGLPPLPEAKGNNYLTPQEVEMLPGKPIGFMSRYYELTRGKETLGSIDEQKRFEAYIEARNAPPGECGPVMAWVW